MSNREALQIEVVMEDDKKFVLTIGKAEGDGYLAISNTTGDDVFLVPKHPFEGAVSKPGYFSP